MKRLCYQNYVNNPPRVFEVTPIFQVFVLISLAVNFFLNKTLLMIIMMNCFCGMVYRWKAFSLISGRDHCQRSSPSRISDTPWAGFELVQNRSLGFLEWSCAVVITTVPRRHRCDTNLEDSIDSSNFSVRHYFTVIKKDCVTRMYSLVVYVKEGLLLHVTYPRKFWGFLLMLLTGFTLFSVLPISFSSIDRHLLLCA